MAFKSDLLSTLEERGFIKQCTNLTGLDELCANNSIHAYIGFDCTAPSLHVGHLLHIMVLRLLQKTGHKPIILLGGGTTRIGDPTGKDETRKMLTPEAIEQNKEDLKKIFARFISFDGKDKNGAIIVDNAEWLLKINYVDFLRSYGTYFTVNRMLSFDSVRTRLEREQPLTFLEFNYMLLQALDFVKLNESYKCRLQLGGSDQWGNIINGVELGRKLGKEELFGLTTPLLTTSSGAKMGKTAAGAVWLRDDYLPTYDYWQFWRNTEDQDVIRFLKLFTDLPLSEINRLAELKGQEVNEAKVILANEVTKITYGEEASKKAAQTAHNVFSAGSSDAGLPSTNVSKPEIESEMPVYKAFVITGLTKSGGEAKRLIKGKGARLNDQVVIDENQVLNMSDFVQGKAKLSSGKKRHALLVLE